MNCSQKRSPADVEKIVSRTFFAGTENPGFADLKRHIKDCTPCTKEAVDTILTMSWDTEEAKSKADNLEISLNSGNKGEPELD